MVREHCCFTCLNCLAYLVVQLKEASWILQSSLCPPESFESEATDYEAESTESSDTDKSDSHFVISLCGLGLVSLDNDVSTEFEQQQSNFVTFHKPSGPTTSIVNDGSS